ncbi:MAG: hypothetical protein WBY94_30625 [Polyangiaceae bacterium]
MLEKASEIPGARLALARVVLLALLGLALLPRLEELAGFVLALLPCEAVELGALACGPATRRLGVALGHLDSLARPVAEADAGDEVRAAIGAAAGLS